MKKRAMTVCFVATVAVALLVTHPASAASKASRQAGDGYTTLLISEAIFNVPSAGVPAARPEPKNARLTILQLRDGSWHTFNIDDSESTAFHKAIPYTDPNGEKGFLTAGADAAMLKLWTRGQDGKWHDTLIWTGSFGGKNSRIRDFEIGDVNGDGKKEIVFGTHDQGVIEVLSPRGHSWIAQEVWRRPETFVHEIELADLDGDGIDEIYATPSSRNLKDRTQGGGLLALRWDGKTYRSRWLDQWQRRHAKEILAADINDDGKPELVAALEAEATSPFGRAVIRQQMELLEYRWGKGGGYVSSVMTQLAGQQCRFLNSVDVDGDGRSELLASTMTAGILLLDRDAKGWFARAIDTKTKGILDAMAVAPSASGKGMDVFASDDSDNQLVWLVRHGKAYRRTVIQEYPQDRLVWYIHFYRTNQKF